MKAYKQPSLQTQSGFSLVELLVYLTILGLLMTLVLMSFTQTMQRSSQQTGIAETRLETGMGIELLRADMEHAGFGLPWTWQNPTTITYTEPAPLSGAPRDLPRALSSADDSASSHNAADYLVIRGSNVIRGLAGQKWGYIGRDANHNILIRSLSPDGFATGDRVMVFRPESSPGVYREMLRGGSKDYYTTLTAITAGSRSITDPSLAPPQSPNDPNGEKYFLYALNDADVRRPFNRTDYFVSNANVPSHCAPGTGVLVKVTANQADDNLSPPMPVVDCVADFQIVYYLDTDDNGGWDTRGTANALANLTAEQVRNQVKGVRFYLLTHDGNFDRSYIHPNATINVGEVAADGVSLEANTGRSFDLSTTLGGDWANYRWRVYSFAITPKNLE